MFWRSFGLRWDSGSLRQVSEGTCSGHLLAFVKVDLVEGIISVTSVRGRNSVVSVLQLFGFEITVVCNWGWLPVTPGFFSDDYLVWMLFIFLMIDRSICRNCSCIHTRYILQLRKKFSVNIMYFGCLGWKFSSLVKNGIFFQIKDLEIF